MTESSISHPLPRPSAADIRAQRFAMGLSLLTGLLMLSGKLLAYLLTNSQAILSDAAESVVHVGAVAFAAFSLWWSVQPADRDHLYGHEKISFFSAGFEGAMIVLAALFIIYTSIEKWIAGLHLENLGTGTLLVAAAGAINGGLGAYLILQGRKHRSLILEANGRHVLTDCWTSVGVIVGLLLTLWTGWLPFDPILAILVALNILWSGGQLICKSFAGLMDQGEPEIDRQIRGLVEEMLVTPLVGFHGLRHRNLGSSYWVEVHLLYASHTSLDQAHEIATRVEARIGSSLPLPAIVTSHLEPADRHDEQHRQVLAGESVGGSKDDR